MLQWRRPILALLFLCVLLPQLGWKKERRQYLKTLESHTRRSLVYHHLATALNAHVTLLDGPMRQAMATERRRLLRPDAANAADFERRMAEDLAAYHEVVFSVDSALDNGKKLGVGDGHWNLRMFVDGTEAPLVSVEWIRRTNPMHAALYAHLDQWSELYIARFERQSADPAAVELQISGGYGNDTLTWNF